MQQNKTISSSCIGDKNQTFNQLKVPFHKASSERIIQ